MKKVISVGLIILVLLNTIGYYGLFVGLQYKNTQELIQRLDTHQYGEEETITLKMPVALPYPVTQDEYTRVDGEVEHNGKFYRLIKQRYANDTLYIVCFKDQASADLKQALAEYVKTFTDKPTHSKHLVKVSLIKYLLPAEAELVPPMCERYSTFSFDSQKGIVQQPFLYSHTPPPKYT